VNLISRQVVKFVMLASTTLSAPMAFCQETKVCQLKTAGCNTSFQYTILGRSLYFSVNNGEIFHGGCGAYFGYEKSGRLALRAVDIYSANGLTVELTASGDILFEDEIYPARFTFANSSCAQ
jgi:hypothetical protein